MIIREELYKIADQLSFNASIEDVIDRLLLLSKVEAGLRQADEGKVISHNEVEQRIKDNSLESL